jgi:hypothetical protein
VALASEERMELHVERISEDRWRVWPQDETWLGIATLRALEEDPLCVAAVVKEHPQHEGVLLRGDFEGLRRGVQKVRELVLDLSLRGVGALRCETYDVASLVRRALLTRPLCLAAECVHFTEKVQDAEYEPVAAHRIGQLSFVVESDAFLADSEAQLLVPRGETAFARHLKLPRGVSLLKGDEGVSFGLQASTKEAETGLHLLALVDLRPDSVFFSKHSKHRAVAGLSYRPEVRIAKPFPKGAADIIRSAGFSFSNVGVVGSKTHAVRKEYVAQLLPDAAFLPPSFIQLDFEPLAYESKQELLKNTFKRLLEEIDVVEGKLRDGGEVSSESRCPDLPSTKSFCMV